MVNTKVRLIYILCSQRWRSSIQSTKTKPGVDCGSDHELLSAKFILVQETGIKTIPKKKKCKKAKWLSGEALQIAVKRREAKAREKRKEYSFECRVQKNSQER